MNGWNIPAPADWPVLVERALAEDLGPGDLTAAAFAEGATTRAMIEAQADGILCGAGIAREVFVHDPHLRVTMHLSDGSPITSGTRIMTIEGPTASLLSRERTALNFLMHLSGVATLTNRFVEAVKGTDALIVDTRKTIPGMRSLQKYAVRCGGGINHRLGLFDAAMIKDNHIAAAGSIRAAVEHLRRHIPHTAKIEVEVDRSDQVDEAIAAGAEIILLDNMAPEVMREVVARYHQHPVKFEASGGVNLQTVRAIAESGVHLISVGALTHSAVAVPLHLEIEN